MSTNPLYFSQVTSPDTIESVTSSTVSPSPIPIPTPTLPPIPFEWPQQVETKYLPLVYEQGLRLRPRKWNPYFFTNGTNHHYGRETYEIYSTKIDLNASNNNDNGDNNNNITTTTTLPSFESLFRASFDVTNPGNEYTPPKFANHTAFPTANDGATVYSLFTAGYYAAGPSVTICHGGMIAAYCDSLLWECVRSIGRNAVTAQLNLTYKAPTPLNSLIIGIASAEFPSPRKAIVRCGLFSEDFSTLYVEANAIFVTPTAWVGMSEDVVYSVDATKATKFDNSQGATAMKEAKEKEEQQNKIIQDSNITTTTNNIPDTSTAVAKNEGI